MSTIWAFDHIKNKHTIYRGKGCTKKFCTSLREHATNVTNFEKKKCYHYQKKSYNYMKMQHNVIFVEKDY